MTTYKIVADSSSNMYSFGEIPFSYVPLKIITNAEEYTDCPELNLLDMVEEIKKTKGTSGTSCPNIQEWLDAFGDAENIFGITITSNLSGAYAAAMQAKADYLETHPGAKVHIFDSLSAGPELRLIAEKIRELLNAEKDFETIVKEITEYQKQTHLLFSLESLTNLSRNGRVSPAVAAIAGVLGIRVVGKASDEGTLEPLHKCRGENKALATIYKEMKSHGYCGGKLRIAHCFNPKAADAVKESVLLEYPDADVQIEPTTALCSFYAEAGGLMIGFEG